jgi:hypothetical protein
MSNLKKKTLEKRPSFRYAAKLRGQEGGTLVEFAIIGPLFFLIVFGIIEFGILIYDKAMLTNASREGARHGIVFYPPSGIADGEIEQRVRDYCEAHLISFKPGSALNIPPPIRSGTPPNRWLTVTVNYPFRFLFVSNLLAWMGNDDLVNLQATTVMRLE